MMTLSPRRLGAAFALALVLAVPTLALAAKKAANPNEGHGKITAVSATSITVTPKKGDAKTFTITDKTKVTLDGQPATVAALNRTSGQHAKIKSKDGMTARRIVARSKGYKKPKGGGKGNPIAPTPL